MTQQQFASASGTSFRSLCRFEKGLIPNVPSLIGFRDVAKEAKLFQLAAVFDAMLQADLQANAEAHERPNDGARRRHMALSELIKWAGLLQETIDRFQNIRNTIPSEPGLVPARELTTAGVQAAEEMKSQVLNKILGTQAATSTSSTRAGLENMIIHSPKNSLTETLQRIEEYLKPITPERRTEKLSDGLAALRAQFGPPQKPSKKAAKRRKKS